MQLVVKGKNMEVSDKLREFVENKISRLERVLPDIAEAEVELSSAKTKSAGSRYEAQVTLKVNGNLIRAEQYAGDSLSAMDAVIEKIDRQIARYKHSKFGAYNKGTSESKSANPKERIARAEEEEEDEEDEEGLEGRVVRTKRFSLKPMDVQEAVEQMQLLGHAFYVFSNSETEKVSVVYKRRDGNFGLIEQE
jgi:putative sigma-54 modulation protein